MKPIAKRLKISQPALPSNFFQTDLISEETDSPVLWVYGPPNIGKTTLINGWLKQQDNPTLWYTFDQQDRQVQDFVDLFLQAAIRLQDEDFNEKFNGEKIADSQPFESILENFNQILEFIPDGCNIVFDDFQSILGEHFYNDLIELFASNHHRHKLIILGHHSPHTHFQHENNPGVIRCLNWQSLKWTQNMLSEFLSRLLDSCTEDYCKYVFEKSDGYLGGIFEIIHTPAVQQSSDLYLPQTLISHFENYLSSFCERDKDTLYLLGQLDPELYNKIADSDLNRIVTQLSQECYAQIDRKHSSFHLQPLFQQFLRNFINELTIEKSATIKLDAANIFAQNQHFIQAATLYKEINHYPELLKLVLTNAPILFSQNKGKVLAELLTLIPENIAGKTGWILYWRACLLQPKEPLKSAEVLQSAESLFKHDDDLVGICMCHALQIDIELFQLSNHQNAEKHVKSLTSLLSKDIPFQSPDQHLRVVGSLFRGIMLRHPAHPDARNWIETQIALANKVRSKTLALQSAVDVGFFYLFTGEFSQAADRFHFARSIVDDKSIFGFTLSMYYRAKAWYELLIVDHESSYQSAKQGVLVADKNNIPTWRFQLLTQMLAAAISANNSDWEAEALSLLPKKFDDRQTVSKSYYYNILAWQAFLNNDLGESLHLQELAVNTADYEGMLYLQAMSQIAYSQIWFSRGQKAQADEWLQKAQQLAEQQNFGNLVFMALCTQAYHKLVERQKDECKAFLESAFKLGAEKAYFNYVWWRNDLMGDLCYMAIKENIQPDYAKELVIKRNLVPSAAPIELEDWPWFLRIYSFGRFTIQGQKMVDQNKIQGKLLLLLKCIVAHGGREVPIDQVVDIIWSEKDADAGHSSFKTSLRRLRQCLGDKKIFIVRDGRISINDRYCWLDIWAFKRTLTLVDTNTSEENLNRLKTLALLYKGPFLKDDEKNHTWIISIQKHYRTMLQKSVAHMDNSIDIVQEIKSITAIEK